MICPNCGRKLEQGEAVCFNCGLDLYAGLPQERRPKVEYGSAQRQVPPPYGVDMRQDRRQTGLPAPVPTPGPWNARMWEWLPFTRGTVILAGAGVTALLLQIIACLFSPRGAALAELYAVLSLSAAICAFFAVRSGLKSAFTEEERDFYRRVMVGVGGALAVTGFFIPISLALVYAIPAVLALLFEGWCAYLIFKIPKRFRGERERSCLIACAVVSVISVLLPAVKILLFLRSLLDTFREAINPVSWFFNLFSSL